MNKGHIIKNTTVSHPMSGSLTQTNTNIPAYIQAKYDGVCIACNSPFKAGELVFYHGASKKCYHGKCGHEDWKAPGTPFAIRKALAISHAASLEDKPKVAITLKDKIKYALRLMRKRLEVKGQDFNKMPHDVRIYLQKNKLVDVTYNGYCIVPRGFNWNVDTESVRFPEVDEDIMDRDSEVDALFAPKVPQ